jgi:hypothetical protein
MCDAFYCRSCFTHKLLKCQSSDPRVCLTCAAKRARSTARGRHSHSTQVRNGVALQKYRIEHNLATPRLERLIKYCK